MWPKIRPVEIPGAWLDEWGIHRCRAIGFEYIVVENFPLVSVIVRSMKVTLLEHWENSHVRPMLLIRCWKVTQLWLSILRSGS